MRRVLNTAKGDVVIFSLKEMEKQGIAKLTKLPYSIRILMESMLRQRDGFLITDDDIRTVAGWRPSGNAGRDIPFIPARVILQDLTGVPAVVDLASMRAAVSALGKDPGMINPLVPVDLVIDHSINTDFAGKNDSKSKNEELEFKRNAERYSLLRWAQTAFENFRAVPPGNGIVHQINMEYLSPVIHIKEKNGELIAYPDSCFGTDSHTPQINGLGVMGWGVGGIEAEAVMLGQPYYMPLPDVIGVRLTGNLRTGITATDLVLTITEMLRKKGVVGKFVEFCGDGYSELGLPDRATIANMAPEYGATMGFFPIDGKTIDYLRLSGRDEGQIDLVEKYAKEQGLWYSGIPDYSDMIELDLSTVEPSMAGPKRPQDRVPLGGVKGSFLELIGGKPKTSGRLSDGFVAIASITSCTNTSNPSLLVTAALFAKNAVKMGLNAKDWVKTSFAPGSKAATQFLVDAGLMQYLEALGFHVAGYGCMTCIGNSGPLSDETLDAVMNGVTAAAVVSANRNFEGRVSPHVKANYLASPPLVIAYAIAGSVTADLEKEPLGRVDGKDIFLKDIWPSESEVNETVKKYVTPQVFREQYGNVFTGSELWGSISVPEDPLYKWGESSTYIRNPPFLDSLGSDPEMNDIKGAHVLAHLGDSITTDHISPAGEFSSSSDAGKYLLSLDVEPKDFNSYGSRRGNHEVMVRGTLANIRLKNKLAEGTEGGYSKFTDGEIGTMYEVSRRYLDEECPMIILAGKEYGTGSSRDWAAKGPYLLGIKAVIAESFERIHRSNLIGMGIVPLQFMNGENAESLGLDGTETYDIGLSGMMPKGDVRVTARKNGTEKVFTVRSRVDVPAETEYIKNGGIIPAVLRKIMISSKSPHKS